jgi:MFS family permease
MPTVTRTRTVDDAGLAELRRSRRDLVAERSDGVDRWASTEGPFTRYSRSLEVRSSGERHEVTETTDYALAVPVWGPLVRLLMSRALADQDRTPRRRWWWPREVVSPTTSNLVATLCVISVMTGYLGVIIGQTITFAAADFGAGDAEVANTLAAVRVGVLLSLVIIHRADRIGRRPLILGFSTAAILFTVIGSLAPSLVALGAAQTISRGLTTGLITLVVLAAIEEVPAGFRAFTISLLTITTALGAGMVVWFLPLNDLIDGGWRLVYLVPAVFLPLLWWVSRYLPETRRFTAAADRQAPAVVNWARFALIGGAAFASALFLSPASQLRNEFLRDDLGYSATAISAFQLVISAPAGMAIVGAGLAADRVGRRWIGAIGLAVGATMLALSYQFTGVGLWLAASAGIVFTGIAFPATRGYGTELFPTRARARVGGLLDVIGVTGSAVGLLTVGYLSERWDDLASAIGVLVFAPLLVALAILTLFPETASTELERFNPSDPNLGRAERKRAEAEDGASS